MIFENKLFTELKEYPKYYIHKDWVLLRETEKGIVVCGQTPNSKKDPYWTVTVRNKKGKFVKRSMHRLLMETFVPNIENKAHVNHKNGNKACRDFDNLEWATPKENAQHAVSIGLKTMKSSYVPVHQYGLNGMYIRSFESMIEAETVTKVSKSNIQKCSVGIRDQAGGYIWSYAKTNTIPAVTRKIISHFRITDFWNNTVENYRYLGLFFKNPNSKKAHPLLKEMGKHDILRHGKYLIERIYYK